MFILYTLIIGLLAGAFAGYIRKGKGYGFVGNIVVGVIGSYVGYFLIRLIQPGVDYGFFGDILVSTLGSLALLSLLSLSQK